MATGDWRMANVACLGVGKEKKKKKKKSSKEKRRRATQPDGTLWS